ncbi:hypothetical protein FHS19_000098 [Paenibacillus rhizosphaerae]|uniref:DinB-like domain-containing protein n=1 Tax=Paenibacillus rhizosphaerae TaxID=297318 RepID=A0A839TFW8_9BACL|nr:hypothetical protein [Paenibacillus rhizosphaerae]MBB3125444.1 hypothetical protein [Paenibacillus rhizosphaerae]
MEKNSQPPVLNAEKLLRHWLGAVRFRFTVAISGTTSDFASFDAGYGVRTPLEIVRHLSQLLHNCCSTIFDSPRVRLETKGWYEEAARFYEIIDQLEQAILQLIPEQSTVEYLVQGPLTDATSHIGQLTMLRRLAGIPVGYINYSQATI